MNSFDAESIIGLFKSKMQDKEREEYSVMSRLDARFPMLTVFLTEKTAETFAEGICAQMEKMWPAYTDVFKYYTVGSVSPEIQWYSLNGETMDVDAVRRQIKEMLMDDYHFRNRLKMIGNFILDASALSSGEEMETYLSAVANLRDAFGFPGLQTNLIVLLDEQLGGDNNAGEIKDALNRLYYGEESPHAKDVSTVFLVSNVTFEGGYADDEKLCNIVADIMTLMDDDDAENATMLTSRDIKAIGFRNVQKPVDQIAKISTMLITRQLTELMIEQESSSHARNLNSESAMSIIGNLMDKLPGEYVLECFPRVTSDPIPPIPDMSFDEFNRLTLGAWECAVFGQFQSTGQIGESAGEEDGRNVYGKIKACLSENLSIFELKGVLSDPDKMGELYNQLFSTNRDDSNTAYTSYLIKDTEEFLRRTLSSSQSLWDQYVKALKDLVEEADEFTTAWAAYTKALNQIGLAKGDSLEQYYDGVIRNYFRQKAPDIKEELKNVKSKMGMIMFLDKLFADIIFENRVYGMSFEEELKTRLIEESDAMDVQNSILEELSSNDIFYTPTHSVLSRPALSSILIKRGSGLIEELENSMPSETLFVDTSNGESIDALQIYLLDHIHLVK